VPSIICSWFRCARRMRRRAGHPLFRITASVSGTGGVACYFRGDVVWCQDRKDKVKWEPLGLDAIRIGIESLHR
jgi:tuftelin-interacting protein 11